MPEFRQPFSGDYPITLDYGEAFPPLYTHESPHRGIDYGCPTGTPIFASADGIVSYTADLKVGYGKFIMLSHNTGVYETIYAHLSEIKVKDRQQVKQGDVIGLSGSTGNSTGPHLHFEIKYQDRRVDPQLILDL